METNLRRLSTVIAKALRHTPEEFELDLDDEGWGSTSDLLNSLRSQRIAWRNITEADFAAIIAQSDKPRFEMRDGRIRALYGHSLPKKLAKTPGVPPEILYHGTNRVALPLVMQHGLKPMGRQYVHFSVDLDMAQRVAKRKGEEVIILTVQAGEAHHDGVVFYIGNDLVWLADHVPASYLR